MGEYDRVIFDEEVQEEIEEYVEPKKIKKLLSDKQLEALAKGRARVAENREKKKKELLTKKKIENLQTSKLKLPKLKKMTSKATV